MSEQTNTELTRDLFQLMKRLPRLKLKQSAIDGLTRSEYGILALLVLHGNGGKTPLSVSDISNLLQITPAGVTHLINKLEDEKYIQRLPDPNDRRIVLIGLSDKGTTVTDGLYEEIREQMSGLVEHLGESDSRMLIRLVAKAIDYLSVNWTVS